MGFVEVLQLKVTIIRVLWPVDVLVMVSDVGTSFMSPVIWTVLNSMSIVMLVHVLRVMLTIVTIRVVVAEVMVTLWFNVMVFTVFFTSEMALVAQMRHMVLQVPVSLLEVSIWVMFESMDKLSHMGLLMFVIMLEWSLLGFNMIIGREILDIIFALGRFALLALLGLLTLFLLLLTLRCGLALLLTLSCGLALLFGRLLNLLLLVVHFLVVKSGLGSHMLLSFSLSLGWLRVVIWVMMVRI